MFVIGGILYFAVKLVIIILNSSFRLIAIPQFRMLFLITRIDFHRLEARLNI